MLTLHGLLFGVLVQENSVVAPRRRAGPDWQHQREWMERNFPWINSSGNWKMKLLRQQRCRTERVSRCSVAGSFQGLHHASARPNQGLQVTIQETCLQFFCSTGLRGQVSETGFKTTSNTCVPKQKHQAQPYTLQLVKHLNDTRGFDG